ncbi:MAG TPA: GxxExxY protein [Candidatus Thermoplasmatota archaeon]|nr:GxxExxY protein [Candidatus Thermoplasmatota archaeon]
MLDSAKSPLTYAIIGALLEVHADLGPGYLEKSYQEAVELALVDRQVVFQREAPIAIRFLGQSLQTVYRADFVCAGQVLLELKAQSDVGRVEEAQVIHYLKGSGLPVGLLANFGEPELRLRRFVGVNYDRDNPI